MESSTGFINLSNLIKCTKGKARIQILSCVGLETFHFFHYLERIYWTDTNVYTVFKTDVWFMMLPIKFQFIWLSGFRGDDFVGIDQSTTRIACGGHVC